MPVRSQQLGASSTCQTDRRWSTEALAGTSNANWTDGLVPLERSKRR